MSKLGMYIKSLHQPRRRAFAHRYLAWRREGSHGVGPMRESFGITWDAATTVRRRIDELLKEEANRAVRGQGP